MTQLQESDSELDQNTYSKWNWTESDFLVVDDINPGVPDEANLMQAGDLSRLIGLQHGERNRKVISQCSIACIVG